MGASDATSRVGGRPINAELSPAILAAVLAELADRGYAGLTTARVARRAGVSTATLYRRWPGKRELVLEAATHLGQGQQADLDTGSTVGDLRELLRHKRQFFSGQLGATILALVAESVHDPELAQVLHDAIVDPTRDHLAAIAVRAQHRSEDVLVSSESATRLVLGVMLGQVAWPGEDVPTLDDAVLAAIVPSGPAAEVAR